MRSASPSPEPMAKTTGWAARYLSFSLTHRRRAGDTPAAPLPPPVSVPVLLVDGSTAVVDISADSSLDLVQQRCAAATGVPAAQQCLIVQEDPPAPGLHGLAQGLAHTASSPYLLKRQLADWSSFLLLPEGVRRELRGKGAGAWLKRHVWEPLQGPRVAPAGTAWVAVCTLDGGRQPLLLSSATTLHSLCSEVYKAAGVPPGQQRLAVVQQAPPGRALRLLRALVALLLAAVVWLAAAARWVLGLPPTGSVNVRLHTQSGREVELDISPDTSLRDLQRLVWETHGEQLDLSSQLSLSPSAGQGAGTASGSSSVHRRLRL